MPTNIATLDDLMKIKSELIEEIKVIIGDLDAQLHQKRWFRNTELQEYLNLSASSIQNLKNSGELPFSKVKGTVFYDINEINKLMKKNKIDFNDS
ncbi:helix-turn-helix domain-containing protein [Psychroflexus aestuariivivens]|uniref:helix-turn-helix domain-containing protein n=1 Tax=Psychroflexus aestuariivivens TaxID=1795040 RepID=UPI000FD6BFF9|nr:helix-turn-helix domain-containing protein [Psychroflexus aestuariivivens]